MDYGRLISEAWGATWRQRSLWVLGLFAGGSAGSCSSGFGAPGGQGDGAEAGETIPGVDLPFEAMAGWLADNVAIIVILVAAMALLGLAMTVISLLAQGGMARATADLAAGQSITAGQAWAAGRRLFWRYLGLWLLLAAVALALALAAAAYVLAVVVLANLTVGGGWAALLAILLGLPVLFLAIAVAIVLSIVVPFAQRAIAVQDVGPLAALLASWRLFRAHLGTSLLVWLLNVALGIAASIVMVLALVAVLVVLGLPGVGLWLALGLSAPTVAYGVVAALVALAVLLVLTSIANTFFWNFWTLAYLRLREPLQ